MNCTKGGVHQSEQLNIVCVEQGCLQSGDYLLCVLCKKEDHYRHQCIHLNEFYKLLDSKSGIFSLEQEQKVSILRQRDQCSQMLNKIQAQIVEAFLEIEQSCQRFYNKMLEETEEQVTQKRVILSHSSQIRRLKETQKLKESIGQALRQMNGLGRNQCIDKKEKAEEFYQDIVVHLKSILQQVMVFRKSNIKDQGIIKIDNELIRSKRESDFKLSQIKRQSRCFSATSNTKQRGAIHFNTNVIHKGIKIQDNIASSLEDKVPFKMLFIHDYADKLPLEDRMWRFKILKCPNYNLNYPLAIGLCYYEHITTNGMVFKGGNDLSDTNGGNLNHGCFLINCMGVSRSCLYDNEERKKVGFRYNVNDIIELWFKPFVREMSLARVVSSGEREEVRLKIGDTSGFKLVPCIRMNYSRESIQLL